MLQKFLTDARFASVNDQRVANRACFGFIRNTRFQYPLHAAVLSKDACAIKLLLWSGADPTNKDSDGLTPLALAQKLNNRNSHARCIVALTQS